MAGQQNYKGPDYFFCHMLGPEHLISKIHLPNQYDYLIRIGGRQKNFKDSMLKNPYMSKQILVICILLTHPLVCKIGAWSIG